MNKLSLALATAVLAALAITGCSHHAAPTAKHPAASQARNADVAIAVRPDAAAGGASTPAGGMTEESESASDISAGLSPIAAAVAATERPSTVPAPSKWTDGKEYTTLVPAQPTGAPPDKVEVVEVFWYGCGHCYHLDPTIESWRQKGKAPYVQFSRVPVMWNDTTRAHARLFYTLESLGKLDQLHTAVFREIHVNNHMLVAQDPAETEKLQRAFLKANGIPEADFDKTYRSFSVESKLQRAEQLGRRYKVAGVPLMVINGKYSADVGTAGGETQLVTLISDLAASEHKH